MKRIKTSTFIFGILLTGFFTLSAFTTIVPNEDILGIWVSEKDPNWKMEFKTNGKCYWYYTDEDTDIFTYTIVDYSNSLEETVQFCGKTVSAGRVESYYLKLEDTQSDDQFCYEIFGLTDNSLSINYLGTSEITVFDKQ